MSLTTCIRRAGDALRAEDKAEILAAAAKYRKAGMTADEAGRKAVDEQIAKVQAMLEAPAEVAAPAPESAAPAVVEDFGEKLPPARRAMAAKLDEDLSDDDIAKRPLSEIWPLAENDAIEDTFAAAVAHAARAEVPAKPRQPYKLRNWVAKVKTVRELAGKIVSGRVTREQMIKLVNTKQRSLKDWMAKVLLLEQVPRDQWKRIGAVEERPEAIVYKDDKEVSSPLLRIEIDGKGHWLRGDGGVQGEERGTVAGNKAAIIALLAAAEPDKRMEFEIRGPSGGPYKINKKGDPEYRPLMTFPTVEEARKAINVDYDSLVAAWEAVKARDNITERDLRSAENRPRAGKDHRGGKDITPQEFQERFGFRGGEFGAWVQQGKGDKERQALLNSAYDALMDLSDIVGVPPRAISLNGTLGIAFGSRGSGWASAHFEPSNLVINLTKTRGAGSLAHEWLHALDNYFARMRRGGEESKFTGDQKQYKAENFITHKPEPLMVRVDGSRFWPPMTAGKLEAMRKANPTAVQYQAEKWMPDPKHPDGVRPEVEKRFADLVAELNSSPMAKRASLLDKGKSDGYWSSTLEMAARAFESYVMARMHESGYHNDFLVNVKKAEEVAKDPARYPYLLAGEIKPIADAFTALFDEVKTREDDAGNVAMFSRASTGRGIPESDARNLASILRAALPKAPPIIIHDSVDKAPQSLRDAIYAEGAERDVEAAYHEGEIHVFPGHIESAERFNFVVGHHEMRHYGIRGILGQQYKQVLTGIAMRNPTLRAAARAKQDAGLAKDLATGVDEALADMPVEEIAALSGIDRLVSRIRQWLREIAAKLREYKLFALADAIDPKEWTDKDVAHFVWKVEDFARRGGSPMSTGGTMFSGPAQTDTEAFRKWFGDSKVVDESGEPLVVYHGTQRADDGIESFGRGDTYYGEAAADEPIHWFTSSPQAASGYANWVQGAGNPTVYPSYVALKNPAGVNDVSGDPEMTLYDPDVIADLKARGFDGIMWTESEYTGEPSDGDDPVTVVAFRLEQIKSAIGNVGTYDPRNPDIRFSRAPSPDIDRAWRDLIGRNKFADYDTDATTKVTGTLDDFVLHRELGDQWAALNVREFNRDDGETVYTASLEVGTEGFPTGTGAATTMYLQALRIAQQRGMGWQSEGVRSDNALAIYNRLRSAGVPFKEDGGASYISAEELAGVDLGAAAAAVAGGRGTMFSRAPGLNMSRKDITKAARNTLSDMLSDAGKKVSWWDKSIGTQYAKARKFRSFGIVFDKVQEYIEDTSTLATQAADMAPDILPKLEKWSDFKKMGISAKDAEAVAAPIFEGTLSNERYDEATLRSRFGLNDRQVNAYGEFYRAVNESLDQVMAAEVIRLLGDKSDALRSLALEDRAALRSGVEQFLDEQVEANPQDAEMVALRDDIRDKYARVDKLKADGYAPLMRFGRYKVHIVDPSSDQTMFFGLYESAADANRAARELMEDPEMQGFRVEQGVLSEKQYEMFAAMPMDSLEMFAEALGAQESDVFKEYIRLAKNNRSALKRLLKRKGTAGYSTDARRVLAAFVTSNARLAAGALNLPGAKEAALNIRDGDVQDEAIGLIQSIQNPQGGAAWARGLMFVNFIGGSIASALVNVTQPLTMTLPWLSQWGGMTKAGKRLMEAGKIASTGKGMDAELAAALKRAEDDGIVSPQEIHYLQSQAMGKMGGHPILQRAAFIWAAPFTMAEQFNRRTSFIAAYLTAKQEGMGEAAFDFAQRAVIETQGLYNPGNQANWARNPVGAAVLTFKQFSVHYLEWMRRMWSAGTPGSAERKAGRKAVLYAMAILILAAGTEGLPFADDLDDLIDTIGQALGYDLNSKRARREFVANTLGMGDLGADVVARGFSAMGGVPFDVSLRMSMGNLVPGTGMLLRSNVDKSREVLELAGPAGGLIDQYTKAGQKALQGDAAGAALQAMPVAIQNVGKAVGMWTTGEARDSKDRRIMDADTMDGLMRFLGFNPQSIARESDKMGMLRRSEQLAKNVEGEIAADWARAQADGDREGVQEAKQRLRDWNEKNPSAKIEISGPQILRRVIQLRKDRAARFITSTSPERRREVSEALQ